MTGQELTAPLGQFEIYTYYNGEFKWRLRGPGGEVMLESGRSWKQRMKCISNIPVAREYMARISRVDPKTFPLD